MILSNLPSDKEIGEFHELYDLLKEIWYLKEDHSFYIDQASSSVLSLAIKKIGKLMHEEALIDEAEDIFFLKMSELNLYREEAGSVGFKNQILLRKKEMNKFKNRITNYLEVMHKKNPPPPPEDCDKCLMHKHFYDPKKLK